MEKNEKKTNQEAGLTGDREAGLVGDKLTYTYIQILSYPDIVIYPYIQINFLFRHTARILLERDNPYNQLGHLYRRRKLTVNLHPHTLLPCITELQDLKH